MTSMVSDFRHTRLYITMVDVILTSGSSDRAFRTTCPDIRHRVSKHCQRHHQGNLKFIMRFYRLESDNLRVTLAAIIERFHTRHGNLRTTLSDTTDTPTTVLTPRKGYYISTRLSDETLEGIRTYIVQ